MQTPPKAEDAKIPPQEAPEPKVDEFPEISEVPDKEPVVAEDELIKDLNLEKFYLQGRMDHEFKLPGNLTVKLRLLEGEELLETNKFLWECTQQNKSTTMVMLEHSMMVIARSILRYGDTDLAKAPLAEREKFVHSLPSVMIPVLSRKYTVLEASVNRFFADAEKVKN